MGNFGTQIAKSAGWLGGAAPAAAAAVPKGIGGLGACGRRRRRTGRSRFGSRSPRRGAVGAQLLARSHAGQRGQADVGHPGQRADHLGRIRRRKPGRRHARRRNRCRARGRRGPALRIQTHRHGPPHVRGLTPHPTHPEGAPTAHPAAGAPSGISGHGCCGGRVNQRQDFFPPHDNGSAKHLVSPLLSGRGDALLAHGAFTSSIAPHSRSSAVTVSLLKVNS